MRDAGVVYQSAVHGLSLQTIYRCVCVYIYIYMCVCVCVRRRDVGVCVCA